MSFAQYQRWRWLVEPVFWILFYTIQAISYGWFLWLDMRYLHVAGVKFQFWQAMGILALGNLVQLALLPAIIMFNRRYPLRLDTLLKNLPYHFLATVAYVILHVSLSLALTNAMYEFMHVGKKFQYGDFWTGVFFQYFRDIRFYFVVISTINFYRLILLRWQGEASLLGTPDDELAAPAPAAAPTAAPAVPDASRPQCFLVRKLGKEFLLPADDIEWVQAQGNYVNLRVRERDYLLRSTIAGFEARLDPKNFVRAHRSYIINLKHLRELKLAESGDARALMAGNSEVPVSRTYLDGLRETAAA